MSDFTELYGFLSPNHSEIQNKGLYVWKLVNNLNKQTKALTSCATQP